MSNKTATQKGVLPKLRFPAFRDAPGWEVKLLGKTAKVLSGYRFPENYQGRTDEEYPFYKVSDISNSLQRGGHFIKEAANYIDAATLKILKAKPLPIGTTIFARIGEAIRSNRRAITTVPCLIDNNVAGIKKIEGKATDIFLYYILLDVNLADYSGGAVPSVNKSTMEKIEILKPSLPEQQKIADCLSSIDELIAAEGQRLEALREHKKGLMQQLFPAAGETLPKLRFPAFRDAPGWEVKPLGAAFDHIKRKNVNNNENLLTISAQDGLVSQFEYFNKRIASKDISGYYLLHKGEFAYNKSYSKGYPMGAIKRLNKYEKGIVSTLYICFRAKAVCNKYFFDHYFESGAINSEISQIAQEGGRNHGLLNIKIIDFFNKVKIYFPELKEQQKIADCLSSIDELIAAEGRRLEALREHKKGLMQQLFPVAGEVAG